MAVTLDERPVRPVERIERWVFTVPLWLLTAVTLTAATVLHGYQMSDAMPETVRLVSDPFTQNPTVGAWRYSSPLTAIIEWAIRFRSDRLVALGDYLTNALLIVGCVLVVARFVSDYAARLFLFAYWCSPNSWAGTASLGVIDTPTLAGLTVAMVAPAGGCFAAGVLLGFNHFELAWFGLAAVAVIRVLIRHDSRTPVMYGFAGLAVGKTLLMGYLIANGISTTGRLDFIRQVGARNLYDGWRGHETIILFAVYSVLWVGVIWMLSGMNHRDRWLTIGLQAFLTVPAAITYDLSRVYRTATWPIVVLLVLYASEHRDRRLVQRAALLLAVAACFVPRTEIWHGGLHING